MSLPPIYQIGLRERRVRVANRLGSFVSRRAQARRAKIFAQRHSARIARWQERIGSMAEDFPENLR
ncbi:MAG: hypothetical protein JWL91_2158 [Sphingomonas bacterium]|nr:hypothetical protein [Sphingomonas bacterium]